jgi:hypothetical protein
VSSNELRLELESYCSSVDEYRSAFTDLRLRFRNHSDKDLSVHLHGSYSRAVMQRHSLDIEYILICFTVLNCGEEVHMTRLLMRTASTKR